MLKSLFHIWLSMIVVLNSMVFSVIQMDYVLNKEYIAENLCINRDKPELHCDGKCFLAEKLKEAQDQQEQQPGSIDVSRDFGLYILQENHFGFQQLTIPPFSNTSFYQRGKYYNTTTDIFHPPQDAVSPLV
ncbi:hypothetical protein [Echinicola vietnamensis]|uniref:Uncharacterized protein n=1 Tax=Echinicola vietnamensis (strain DSM 17526 / LMG 23754 / KMM 6221) TaxID=926556 RepID=L0G3W5_ECHVK|nr:hypothetical protein [Echinicola vietnamensis]AGA80227.1 hypothetical protein Echvi_4020 [Echinicola vietnamensis DSM 17526]